MRRLFKKQRDGFATCRPANSGEFCERRAGRIGLTARTAIEQLIVELDREVLKLLRHDAQVRRFMTVPGVGPITALCFKAASSYAIVWRACPTAERTVGPARMIAESLTPNPGIRKHNRMMNGHHTHR